MFVIGVEEGVFPHMRAIESGDLEEERRLAYVALTRAKRELYLSYARTRTLFGQRDWNVPSRFLGEIPRSLTDLEDEPSTPQRAAGSWSSGGGDVGATSSGAGAGASFALGDDVVHASFGDGVIIGVEPGGLVVVRFAGDGSERKLMADYAPLKKRG